MERILKTSKRFVLGICNCGCKQSIPVRNTRRNISRYSKDHHIKFLHKLGTESYNWKGGDHINGDGHRIITIEPGKRQVEHRYTYEMFYQCCLLPWAIVHHINGDKVDNRIENLQGMMRRQHPPLHNKYDPKKRRFK